MTTVLTPREMVDEVTAIFHLEGMDIPLNERVDLLAHLEADTLNEYVAKILSEGKNEHVSI